MNLQLNGKRVQHLHDIRIFKQWLIWLLLVNKVIEMTEIYVVGITVANQNNLEKTMRMNLFGFLKLF